MNQVVKSAWALLLGIGLLQIGNGMQGTLLGIRGEIEAFTTTEMSIIIAAYFAGFLGGSRLAPGLIRRVGHVRVFAALASLISAVIILYPAAPDPWVWTVGRVLIGFCFSAVYVTSESWLNNAATNETRGQALSAYMIVQTLGIIAAQVLLLAADPSGYVLFVIPSILVSIAVTPILLSISPTPAFGTTKQMKLKDLLTASPLGAVGMFLLGGVFAAQFGMSAIYGTQADLSIVQISTFVSMFFVGALVTQYPIGWASDRMDRRQLVVFVSGLGAVACVIGALFGENFTLLLVAAFMMGGASNPLYSLLIAHTNDFLDHDDMAGASGALIFLNGLGAIFGPIITGQAMAIIGPEGFFFFTLLLFVALTIYALYRMTQRATIAVEDTGAYVAMTPASGTVAVELAQEYANDEAREETP
ncbi:MFS transporter [Aliishimia ponticola]|uniref:MFS transporter n=1 Tax=Aliishimia ponticola TaxID=2499833 RepID=A0A4S4NI14_9RHOB|nr:MFS transporter [Aliishimia ponticola]THH38337.1 MFS transporter [Aliishimia ponticola]